MAMVNQLAAVERYQVLARQRWYVWPEVLDYKADSFDLVTSVAGVHIAIASRPPSTGLVNW